MITTPKLHGKLGQYVKKGDLIAEVYELKTVIAEIPIAEKEIDEGLRMRGCTCIIVAHRLSTIRDSDEILVMDRGRVVERGTHDDLVRDVSGLYRQLIQA